MIRTALAVAALSLAAHAPARGQKDLPKKDAPKPTVDLSAVLLDRELQKEAPAGGVVASAKAWEKLAKAWEIKDAPKVDFDKELLVVATTVGSRLTLGTELDGKGDLRVVAVSTDDLRPGFQYKIRSVSRAGVKTVNGKELPKE